LRNLFLRHARVRRRQNAGIFAFGSWCVGYGVSLVACAEQPALPQGATAHALISPITLGIIRQIGKVFGPAFDPVQVRLQNGVEKQRVGIVGAAMVEDHQVVGCQVAAELPEQLSEEIGHGGGGQTLVFFRYRE
jgi:hypothetical protein